MGIGTRCSRTSGADMGRGRTGMRCSPIPEDTGGRGHGDTDQGIMYPGGHGGDAAPASPSSSHLIVQEIEVIALRLPQLRILQPARRRRHSAGRPGTDASAAAAAAAAAGKAVRAEGSRAGPAIRSGAAIRSEPPVRPRRAPVSRQTRLLSRHCAGNPPLSRPTALMIGRQRPAPANETAIE